MAVNVTAPFILLVTIVILMFGASKAWAYENYSGCNDCHGGFRDSPYISLSDGSNWGNDLHDVHRNDMLSGECDACHTSGGRSPVFLGSSNGGNGLAAISCSGCHGRDEDMGSDSISSGRGAGLRQHHTNAGVQDCKDCHTDADPALYTPVGEDVLPNYFANPGTGHTSIPMDSCNPAGEEDFAGTPLGLDNDGDGTYDTADSNCSAVVPTYSVGGSVSGLTGSGLALQNNGADTLAIGANGSFTFAAELQQGNAYAVTVSTQPTGQTCSVTNGSGTIATIDVTNISVTCEDIPSLPFEINAGLNDVWFNPVTSGQGFFITVFPDTGRVALSWFTYDTNLPPQDAVANLGDPGHRWFNALGAYSGDQAVLDISMASGGLFDTPTEIARVGDGTIILTFTGCNSGTVEYDIPSIGQSSIVPIERIVTENVALCESLEGQAAVQSTGALKTKEDNRLASSSNPVSSIEAPLLVDMNAGLNDAWFDPATSGQGFFITVFPDTGRVSLSWFTYDTSLPPEDAVANLGDPGHRWFNALGSFSGNQAVLDISITSGGLFDTTTEITRVDDGTVILTFTDCNNGTAEYNIPSIGQSGIVPMQRVVTDNVALCESFIAQ